MKYKVLSLWQPWAQLVVLGHKMVETRCWKTEYRGPLLIHSAKKWNKELSLSIAKIGAYDILAEAGYEWNPFGTKTTLPLGEIIGMVTLEEIAPTEQFFTPEQGQGNAFYEITPKEKAFGDYSPGRYGWLLSGALKFDNPIPAKGLQKLWNYESELPLIDVLATKRPKQS